MIPLKFVQLFLRDRKLYYGKIDGLSGPQTKEAITKFFEGDKLSFTNDARKLTAIQQAMLKQVGIDPGPIDGYVGPQTQEAFRRWVKLDRDNLEVQSKLPAVDPVTGLVWKDVTPAHKYWPAQADMDDFYGEKGKNQIDVLLPYPLIYAYGGKQFDKITMHKLVADATCAAMEQIKRAYGNDLTALGINVWGGTLNVRKMVGGTKWSTHSWGAAHDFDPQHNDLHTPFKRARFGAPEYAAFWRSWKEQGATCLGPDRNYDTMHIQFANL